MDQSSLSLPVCHSSLLLHRWGCVLRRGSANEAPRPPVPELKQKAPSFVRVPEGLLSLDQLSAAEILSTCPKFKPLSVCPALPPLLTRGGLRVLAAWGPISDVSSPARDISQGPANVLTS